MRASSIVASTRMPEAACAHAHARMGPQLVQCVYVRVRVCVIVRVFARLCLVDHSTTAVRKPAKRSKRFLATIGPILTILTQEARTHLCLRLKEYYY